MRKDPFYTWMLDIQKLSSIKGYLKTYNQLVQEHAVCLGELRKLGTAPELVARLSHCGEPMRVCGRCTDACYLGRRPEITHDPILLAALITKRFPESALSSGIVRLTDYSAKPGNLHALEVNGITASVLECVRRVQDQFEGLHLAGHLEPALFTTKGGKRWELILRAFLSFPKGPEGSHRAEAAVREVLGPMTGPLSEPSDQLSQWLSCRPVPHGSEFVAMSTGEGTHVENCLTGAPAAEFTIWLDQNPVQRRRLTSFNLYEDRAHERRSQ